MESKYIIIFKIDQCDGDYITIGTDLIDGIPSQDLLINLCIVNNHEKLDDYDGEWYNLLPMQKYLEKLWNGFFEDAYNRFTISKIEIKGFDANSMSWYEINDFSMVKLKKLGIKDINKEYEERFKINFAIEEVKKSINCLLSQLPSSTYTKEKLDEIAIALKEYRSNLEEAIVNFAENGRDIESILNNWNSIVYYFKNLQFPPLIKEFESFAINFNKKKQEIYSRINYLISDLDNELRDEVDTKILDKKVSDLQEKTNATKNDWEANNKGAIIEIEKFNDAKTNIENQLKQLLSYILAVRYETVGEREIYSKITLDSSSNQKLLFQRKKIEGNNSNEFIGINYIGVNCQNGKNLFVYKLHYINENRVETIESDMSPEELSYIIYWSYFNHKFTLKESVKDLEPNYSLGKIPFLSDLEKVAIQRKDYSDNYRIDIYTPDCVRRINQIMNSENFKIDSKLEKERDIINRMLQEEREEYKANLNEPDFNLNITDANRH